MHSWWRTSLYDWLHLQGAIGRGTILQLETYEMWRNVDLDESRIDGGPLHQKYVREEIKSCGGRYHAERIWWNRLQRQKTIGTWWLPRLRIRLWHWNSSCKVEYYSFLHLLMYFSTSNLFYCFVSSWHMKFNWSRIALVLLLYRRKRLRMDR